MRTAIVLLILAQFSDVCYGAQLSKDELEYFIKDTIERHPDREEALKREFALRNARLAIKLSSIQAKERGLELAGDRQRLRESKEGKRPIYDTLAPEPFVRNIGLFPKAIIHVTEIKSPNEAVVDLPKSESREEMHGDYVNGGIKLTTTTRWVDIYDVKGIDTTQMNVGSYQQVPGLFVCTERAEQGSSIRMSLEAVDEGPIIDAWKKSVSDQRKDTKRSAANGGKGKMASK